MRTLTLLALGVLFVVGTVLPVNAQAPATPQPARAQEPAPAPTPQAPPMPDDQDDDESRFFFSVNMGGQSKEQSFSDSSTFTIYNESGAVASAQSFGGGTLFDVGAGARIWKGLGIGIAYSTVKNFNPASLSVRVPHPVLFGQSRTATATVEDLEHSENVVHVQFLWMIPLTSKFHITAMVGPSFFTVRQTVASVRAPQDIVDPAPFNNLSIRTATLTDIKDSPVGFNIGADGTYVVRTIKGVGIGVGGFVRFTSASIDLATEATGDAKLKAGGPQGGAGLRVRF
jgi:hypothetical protein